MVPMVILASCASDQLDTEAPVLTDVQINGSEERITVQTQTVLDMDVVATDNEGVSQIKIDIHEAFDGHDHGKREQSSWTYVKIIETSGPSVNVEDNPLIPQQVASGPYHAVFRVLDESGNEGAYVERQIVIENGSQPMVQLTAPAENDTFTLGETITPTGMLTDADGLKEVHLVLLHLEDDHAHDVAESEMELTSNPTSFDLSTMSVTVPSAEEAGTYRLLIKAVDVLENHTIFTVDLNVIE